MFSLTLVITLVFSSYHSYCINGGSYLNFASCNSNQPPQCSRGGSAYCQCSKNCLQFENKCVGNGSNTLPTVTTKYPCLKNDPTDVNCNSNGFGSICPFKCQNQNNQCRNDDSSITCHPHKKWSCPIGCLFNNKTKSCLPLQVNRVCGLIKKTLTCPNSCSYHNYLKKCVSQNPNYLCGPEKKLACPQKCVLNIRGDTCVPINSEPNVICNRTLVPHCPKHCAYDPTNKICRIDTTSRPPFGTLCEPVSVIECPFGVFGNNFGRMVNCDVDSSDICSNNARTFIQYPLRLHDKYSKLPIRCRYAFDARCTVDRMICCN